MCVDTGTDHEISVKSDAALKKMGCNASGLEYLSGSYVYDSTCKIGANTMKTHSVVSYPSVGAIHSVTTVDMGGGAPPSTMTSDSKWIAACKPGQKPGEGEIMNMGDFRKGQK